MVPRMRQRIVMAMLPIFSVRSLFIRRIITPDTAAEMTGVPIMRPQSMRRDIRRCTESRFRIKSRAYRTMVEMRTAVMPSFVLLRRMYRVMIWTRKAIAELMRTFLSRSSPWSMPAIAMERAWNMMAMLPMRRSAAGSSRFPVLNSAGIRVSAMMAKKAAAGRASRTARRRSS